MASRGGSSRGKSIVGSISTPIPTEESNPFEDSESPFQQSVPVNAPSQTGQANNSTETTLKSNIFKIHFTKVCNNNDGIVTHGKCNYCGSEFKHCKGGGYGTFNRHMEKKHPDKLGHSRSQSQIRFTTDEGTGTHSSLFTFSQAKYRDKIAETISVERLPFSFAERCQVQECINETLQPACKKVSRRTIQRTIFKQYKNGREQLCEYFRTVNSSISLCSDVWTDVFHENSFMGITAHWVDDKWNIQKRVLAFRVFNESHTAENIYRLIRGVIEDFGLMFKIFSISFDNASANTASIRPLEEFLRPSCGGKYFHIRCVCHVLNLCVQTGLQELKEYVLPVREVVAYLGKNMTLMKQWARYCKAHNMRVKKFPKDVKTRWNSTYRLLSATFPYRTLLTNFVNDSLVGFHLYEYQWVIIARIIDFLSIFDTCTNLFSQVYFPTSHLFLYGVVDVAEQFWKYRSDPQLFMALIPMRIKWLLYYKDIPPIALVAFVLDPRQKLEGLQAYLEAYYKFLGFNGGQDSQPFAMSLPMSEVDTQDDEADPDGLVDVNEIVADTRNQLIELYDSYCIRYSHVVPQVAQEPIGQSSSSGGESFRQRQAKKKPRGSQYTELDLYLNTTFRFCEQINTDMTFNVLQWWQGSGNPYPILSLMVKDIFACPMSTVACEQTFSAGGNMLDTTRSQLTPQNIEIQVCTDDWKRAQVRQQEAERQSPDGSDFFYTDNMMSTPGATTANEADQDPDDDE
ncbi:Tam3-transposase (Ac family) protein [Dioscorea alata]|uniref:Tam3-transposase (Ac family) protein n=1 Tax=Dioscorea alata TaxID=55571 RepID=A0ACB7US36_DIOAL|nr:Tam3-transposase (Ac family) protein [Dioscorea alata]